MGDPIKGFGVGWDPKRRGFTPKSGLQSPIWRCDLISDPTSDGGPQNRVGDPKIECRPHKGLGDPIKGFGVGWDPKPGGFTPKSGLQSPIWGCDPISDLKSDGRPQNRVGDPIKA